MNIIINMNINMYVYNKNDNTWHIQRCSLFALHTLSVRLPSSSLKGAVLCLREC